VTGVQADPTLEPGGLVAPPKRRVVFVVGSGRSGTSTMATPVVLAVRVSGAAHSRTCATEPGAEVSCSE